MLALFSLAVAPALAQSWQWAKNAGSNGNDIAWDVACDTSSSRVYACGSFSGNMSAYYGSSFSSSSGPADGFISKYDVSGNLIWAIKIGGNGDDGVRSIAVDPYGYIYATGYFHGTADMDPGSGTYNLSVTGGMDGFLAKYTATGTLVWAVKYGGNTEDEPWKLCCDSNSVYVTGRYDSPSTFYSTSSATATTAAPQAQQNMFAVKYNASGVVQWAVSGGSNKDDMGYRIIADHSSVYLVGNYSSPFTLFNASGVSCATLPAYNNNSDVFIASFTQGGSFQWATNIASTTDDNGFGITQDNTKLYVTGSISSTASFSYPTAAFTKTCQGGTDIFLTSLNKNDGVFQWVSSETGSANNDEVANGIAMNASGHLVLTGYYSNHLDFTAFGGTNLNSSGTDDIFISTYDLSGSFLSANSAGANSDDVAHSVACDNAGGSYIAGEHAGSSVFGSTTLNNAGGKDIFLAKAGCTAFSNNTINSPQTVCAGTVPAQLNGSVPSGGSAPYAYLWKMSTDNSTWTNAPGANTLFNYTPPALTTSTYFARTVSSSGACTNSLVSASVLISVDSLPTASVAGNDQAVCSAASVLNGNNPSIGSGFWYRIAGSGTIANPTTYNSAVSFLGTGTNTFVWKISNGSCPASRDTVSIVRSALPTSANAGNDQTICSSNALLSGNIAFVGNGSWQVIAGSSSVGNSSQHNTTVSALTTGLNAFVWTISNGVCPPSSDTVIIQVDATPTPSSAGSDQAICANSSSLAANTPVSGTGQWSVITGSGTIANAGSGTSAVTALGTGVNSFVWTITSGVCPASRDTVKIDVSAMPSVANAGNDQSLCAANTYLLNAANPSVGTGVWTVLAGNATVNLPAQHTTLASGLSSGDNIFSWTVSNGVCPSSADTVIIHRDEMPDVANAGGDQLLCAITSPSLQANTPVIGSGLWTLLSGSAVINNPTDPQTTLSNLSTGNSAFLWTISNGVCPSSSDAVLLHVDALPDQAMAGPDQAICANTSMLTASSVATGIGSWSLIQGTATIANNFDPGSAVSGLSTGDNALLWTVTNGICQAHADTLIIHVDPPPSAADAGLSQVLCGDTVILSANVPQTGFGSWTIVNESGSFSDPQAATTAAMGFAQGQHSFVWTINSGVCVPSSDTVLITTYARPSAAVAGNNKAVCDVSTQLAANVPSFGNGSWQVLSGTATIADTVLANTMITGLSVGETVVRWTISNGTCPDRTDDLIITRDALPDAAIAGPDVNSDIPVVNLSANAPLTGSGSWSIVSGSGIFTDNADPKTTVSDLDVGTTILKWTITNGVCPASTDEIAVTLNPLKIPNGFSPNDDGVNDQFVIPTLEYYPNAHISIFNRWGSVVYEASDYKNNWSGKNSTDQMLCDDTYYYLLELKPGSSYNGFIILKTTK